MLCLLIDIIDSLIVAGFAAIDNSGTVQSGIWYYVILLPYYYGWSHVNITSQQRRLGSTATNYYDNMSHIESQSLDA